jgi:hypothetical protein
MVHSLLSLPVPFALTAKVFRLASLKERRGLLQGYLRVIDSSLSTECYLILKYFEFV